MSTITKIPISEKHRVELSRYYIDDLILDNAVIGGGFVLYLLGWCDIFGDIDLFTTKPLLLHQYLIDMGFTEMPKMRDYRAEYKKGCVVLQIIDCQFDYPSQVIEHFDFDYIQAFITENYIAYTGRCELANQDKKIREINVMRTILDYRVNKARSKGYMFPNSIVYYERDINHDWGDDIAYSAFNGDFTKLENRWVDISRELRIVELSVITKKDYKLLSYKAVIEANKKHEISEDRFIVGEEYGGTLARMGITGANEGPTRYAVIIFENGEWLIGKYARRYYGTNYPTYNVDPDVNIIPDDSGYHLTLRHPNLVVKSARK